MMRHFSLKYIGETFVHQLRSLGYTSRLKKIEIPDKYTAQTEFAKEGICWLIELLLKESGALYSESYQLQWTLVAYS
jgi:hypothetical protein